jgi:hypothetical protein
MVFSDSKKPYERAPAWASRRYATRTAHTMRWPASPQGEAGSQSSDDSMALGKASERSKGTMNRTAYIMITVWVLIIAGALMAAGYGY